VTDHHDIRDDLEPGAEEELIVLAERLHSARPVPRPAFRGDLGRRLAAQRRPRFAPGNIRALITTYALAGIVLLCLGTVSAAGVGPLG
jgi:hypothetical protein